jgi:hypothetical protein
MTELHASDLRFISKEAAAGTLAGIAASFIPTIVNMERNQVSALNARQPQ